MQALVQRHVREARFQAHSKTVVFKNKCLKGGLPPMLSSLLLLLGLGGFTPPSRRSGGVNPTQSSLLLDPVNPPQLSVPSFTAPELKIEGNSCLTGPPLCRCTPALA